jgi:hypothetical protein
VTNEERVELERLRNLEREEEIERLKKIADKGCECATRGEYRCSACCAYGKLNELLGPGWRQRPNAERS